MLILDIVFFSIVLLKLSSTENANSPEFYEEIFKKLYKQRRAEQVEAVKNLKRINKYERQYSMISLMAEKVFTVIQECRAQIESSGYIPGVSEFPANEKTRDALSNILENTALFSEVIIRFPDITESVLKTNNNWDILLQWSLAFCHQVEYLLDKSTIKLLNLVRQELNHLERDPNYVNPYRKVDSIKDAEGQDAPDAKKKKKKKQFRRGPRLTSFGEL